MRSVAAVRYGAMDNIEQFEAAPEGLCKGDHVIVRTERGLEWGTIVSQPSPEADADGRGVEPKGEISRKATTQDAQKQEDIRQKHQQEEFQFCAQLIEQHGLPMKLAGVEHLFGGHRMIFFFLAGGRVDFRALVKDLAKRYRTRIEMRQIGVRDEARLLGQFGPCGRELCCRTFLKVLKPIPMKIAKRQKSTLDPAKISGRCGRLKCCLNFEEALYKELKRKLPRRGTSVKTPTGEGVVVHQEIIEQAVTVRFADGTEQKLPLDQIEVQGAPDGHE